MFDFFDEEFPLSKKQEEEFKKREAQNRAENGENPPEDDIVIQNIPDDVIYGEPKIAEIDLSDVEIDEPYDEEDSDEPDEAPQENAFDEPENVSDEEADESFARQDEAENTEVSDAAETVAEDEKETAPAETAEIVLGDDEALEILESAEDAPMDTPVEEPDTNADEPENDETGRYDEWADIDGSEAVTINQDPSDEHLRESIKALSEKLDNMERIVDGMEDGELPEGFEYEYDERYYAEDETPAFKHPELYSNPTAENTGEASETHKPVKKTSAPPEKTSKKSSDSSLVIRFPLANKEYTVNADLPTVLAAGLAAAGMALLVRKMFKGKKK